jgi:hypothetical protein
MGILFILAAVFFIFPTAITIFISSYDSYSSDYYSYGQSQSQPLLLLSALIALVGITLTALGLLMTIGVRSYLAFSDKGIAVPLQSAQAVYSVGSS